MLINSGVSDMKKIKIIACVFCFILQASCSKTITLQSALSYLENAMKEAGVSSLSVDDLDSDFTNIVKRAQCVNKKANPIIPLISKELNLTIRGEFSETGSFTIGTVTTIPTLGLGGSASESTQQTIMLPLIHVPVSAVWKIYIQQNITLFSNLPDPEKSENIKMVITHAKLIELKANQLIQDYKNKDTLDTYCKPYQNSPGPVAPLFPFNALMFPSMMF